ncbi:MAG: hypothetical protein WAK33_24805, partial [Silvibacterium sp.]
MTGRVFTKLFFSFVLVLAIGTAILDISLGRVVEESLRDQLAQSLVGKARLLAREANPANALELKQLAARGEFDAGAQVTFFGRDGSVLASSETLEERKGTPEEVRRALTDPRGAGQSERGDQL